MITGVVPPTNSKQTIPTPYWRPCDNFYIQASTITYLEVLYLGPCEYLLVEQQLLSVFCRQSTGRDPRCSIAAGYLPAHYCTTHSLPTKSLTKREANEGPSRGRKDHRRCFPHCPNYSAKVAYIHRSSAFSLLFVRIPFLAFLCLSSDSPSFLQLQKGKGSEEQGSYQKQSGLR